VTGFRIEALTAFTIIGEDDEEGVMAFHDAATRTWIPMIAADERRVEQLRGIARSIRPDGDYTERRFVPEVTT
jgi:hypothetical protein